VVQVDAEVVGKTRKYISHMAWKPKIRPPTDQQPLRKPEIDDLSYRYSQIT
jgi:hypothetical protein